jgi:hypothetical protein
LALLLAALMLTSCAQPAKTLSKAERKACVAEGGYESRSAFGYPICQADFADAGRTCSDKSDCQGRCLVMLDGPPGPLPQPGDPAKGVCQPRSYTPGCYAEVEQGKVAKGGGYCVD